MLLIRFEDYKQNITKELIRTYQFLGLDTGVVSNRLDGIVSQEIKNQGKLKKKVEPMLENTERLLSEFYQPFITRLSGLLEDNKFLWKDLKAGT
ncbi:hypothetical protein V1264_020736 [Littorina saxatilis]|uniref:Sulfotransferase n=1 Tax=Littorina saxatilis TaxID=31220 RepID=A0AAN9BAV6_9CAEN